VSDSSGYSAGITDAGQSPRASSANGLSAGVDRHGADSPGSAGGVDVVRLRLPATGVYLSVLRSATAGLAARLDFTLEEIEDLRIAVDEACALLLPSAVAGADLDCEFALAADELRVSVTVETSDGAEPARDSFAWTVLSALAGEVSSRVSGSAVSIDLLKRRAIGVST
jgi:serine/threonine-protein kinase RsbW